jgi:hypothetical protein
MALIDDHMTVGADHLREVLAAREGLHHRYVECARKLVLATAKLADGLDVDVEEHGELRTPLVEQRHAMHEDESVAPARGRQVRADHGLADARRSHEHADLVVENGARGSLLDRRQRSVEPSIERGAARALLTEIDRDPVFVEDRGHVAQATARECEVLLEHLRA